MGFWTSIVNYGKSAVRGSGRVITYGVTHPKQTAIAGATGYAGWQYLANDRPLIDSAGDMASKAADITFGEKRVDKATEIATDTAKTVGDKIDSATDTLSGAVNTARETHQRFHVGSVKGSVCSNREIRVRCSHGDSLYFGCSIKNCIPNLLQRFRQVKRCQIRESSKSPPSYAEEVF